MKTVLGCSARFAAIAVSGMIAAAAPPASAHEDADPHAHHHMMRDMKMSSVAYSLPDVTLVRDDDRAVSLKDALNDGRPVVLTFIYTTCTSICPVISQTLSQLQAKLGPDRDKVHLVSISIDPENDTPARLRAYAAKFGAGAGMAALHRHACRKRCRAESLQCVPGGQDGPQPGGVAACRAGPELASNRRIRDGG